MSSLTVGDICNIMQAILCRGRILTLSMWSQKEDRVRQTRQKTLPEQIGDYPLISHYFLCKYKVLQLLYFTLLTVIAREKLSWTSFLNKKALFCNEKTYYRSCNIHCTAM